MQDIGGFIYRTRKHLNLSRKMLAEKSGVGLTTIVCIEKGERNNLRFDTATMILNELGYELEICKKGN